MASVEDARTRVAPPAVLVFPKGLDLGGVEPLIERDIALREIAVPFEASVSAGRGTVYLVGSEHLVRLGGREQIENALLILEAADGVTVVLNRPEDELDWLATKPYVSAWLRRPFEAPELAAAIRNAARLADLRSRNAELSRRVDVGSEEREQLLAIGLALSAERDIGKLQRMIVRKAREITNADGGSLFLVEDGDEGNKILRFAVAQTGPDDEGSYLGAKLPLLPTSISGYVSLCGEVVRIADAYEIGETREYRFNPTFDKNNNYRTKSVLCVPMRDHTGTVVGAIQLLNRKPSFELVLQSPEHTEAVVRDFTTHDEKVLLSLASQAAVALENKELLASIETLFEQFVRASVKAIEARDRATQGHSERVAELTVLQAETINRVHAGIFADLKFDADQVREMRYASLLHDFGKVAVPEYIFAKAKKLPDGRLDVIRLRFLLAIEQEAAGVAQRKLDLLRSGASENDRLVRALDDDLAETRSELEKLLKTVEEANEPRVVAESVGDELAKIAKLRFSYLGEERPIIDESEFSFLHIARGSLAPEERRAMELHVTQSFLFLREIPWTRTPWRNVADIAYGHHEHLDGTGYPRGLKGDEIAPQVRMMTISDVYDALTANDRPYKPAMSVERALDILTKEFAQRGKVDAGLLDLFIAEKVYEKLAKPA